MAVQESRVVEIDPTDIRKSLREAVGYRDAYERLVRLLVVMARQDGCTWEDIAEDLGMARASSSHSAYLRWAEQGYVPALS